jgi:hypothetical protein
MAGNFGNAEASGRPVAPGGFNPHLPDLPGFVEYGEVTCRAGATQTERPRHEAALFGSLVYRPMILRRNDVGWIAACAWRAAAKVDDLAALKRAKRELDRRLIIGAAELVATLIEQLRSDRAADAITNVPCGHSRRPDCFGKRLAEAVASSLKVPFIQVFADRFCEGVSHSKEFRKLPPLHQIADPLPSMIVVDDLAAAIAALLAKTVVITGGARGPDQWVDQASRARCLEVIVYQPDLDGVRARWQLAERFYARNQRLVDDSDRVIAFVSPDRSGGTEDTIRGAVRAGNLVEVR